MLNPRLIPPDLTSLPDPVVVGERLRGSIVPLGPGFRSVGWPETAAVRCMTLKRYHQTGLAFINSSAAWVWGSVWPSGHPVELSTFNAKRFQGVPLHDSVVREFNIKEEETIDLVGMQVSSPERTVFDLLFLDPVSYDSHGRAQAEAIITSHEVDTSALADRVAAYPRPYYRAARQRLEGLITG